MSPLAQRPDSAPLRALVADGDSTTRALFASMIRSMGHHVTTAIDGRDALSLYELDPPQLVVVDWMMPAIDGLEFIRRVRARTGDECFIMLVAARHGPVDLDEALSAGADDYATKPVSAGQFRARVVIAERRIAQATARRAAEAEAAKLRWLAGVGETVLTLQHEINDPLTALYGSLDLIGHTPGLPDNARQDLDRARQQAKRIADAVNRISNLDRHATIELLPGLPMLDLGAAVPSTEQESATAV